MIGGVLLVLTGVLVLLAGGFPRRTPTAQVSGRVAGALVPGAVLYHLGLSSLQLFDVRWNAWSTVALAMFISMFWLGRPFDWAELRPRWPGWGLVVAAAPVAFFGFLSSVRLAHTPDFVFHWGQKAARWAFAGGIDLTLLDRPGAWRIHPDYPQLVPELMALPGLLAGRFDERAALLEAAAVAAVTVLAFRFALRSHGMTGFELEASTAVCGAAVGGFGFVYGMAGGADAWIALALLVGVAALVAAPGRHADTALAWSAALAAAAKIEGVPLAGLLIAAALWQRRGAGLRDRAWPVALPALLVVVPWWIGNLGRFLPSNSGPPRWADLMPILSGVASSAVALESGFWPLLVLLLPFVPTAPRLRPAACVLGGQLALFVVFYLISPVNLDLLVRTSSARLLSHLVPATLLLVALWLKSPTPAGGAQGAVDEPARSG